jgi:hypothetical protein
MAISHANNLIWTILRNWLANAKGMELIEILKILPGIMR